MEFADLIIKENKKFKVCKSSDYNYLFNKENGFFVRFGKDKEDDPLYAPGPEIADIEVTTICHGVGGDGKLCPFCYKSNNPIGTNMSFETFVKVFNKFPKTLTQIAFGVDAQATSNPELFKMMHYCRNNDYNYVVPNITVAEISDEIADKLVNVCGAVAVSRYEDKNYCYDGVKKLTDRGMKQCNIHILASQETYDQIMETLKDRLTDPRLAKLNAIVFLALKQKGRGVHFNPLSVEKFRTIVDFALDNNISVGFDSCSCAKFLESVKDRKEYKQFETCSEPCESSLFSVYVNTYGLFFPCSFSEGEDEWSDGIDIVDCDDFMKDVWNHPRTLGFRNKLLGTACKNNLGCRTCPLFKV